MDGIWRCSGEFPTESDPHGNVNNWRIPGNEPQYASVVVAGQQEKLGAGKEMKQPEKVPAANLGAPGQQGKKSGRGI